MAMRLDKEMKEQAETVAVEKRQKRKKVIKGVLSVCIIVMFIAVCVLAKNAIDLNHKYKTAVTLMEDGEYANAVLLFEELNGYKDSSRKIRECRYSEAEYYYNAGLLDTAVEIFRSLYGYKDSDERIADIYNEVATAINVGDSVWLGKYEQDNDTNNGKEDIEWRVLAKEGTKFFLLSDKALDCQPYNTSDSDVTWEDCYLRDWLNNTFINEAFSAEEQMHIQNTTVSADNNPVVYSRSNPGNATNDKIFLLSIPEVNKYFTTDELRKSTATAYAEEQGAGTTEMEKTVSGEDSCWWWLRSPGINQNLAAFVNCYGQVYNFGVFVDNDDYAVRPAMWFDIAY